MGIMMTEEGKKRVGLKASGGSTIIADGASIMGWENTADADGDGSLISLDGAKFDGSLAASSGATITLRQAEMLLRDAGLSEAEVAEAIADANQGGEKAAASKLWEWAKGNLTDPEKIAAIWGLIEKFIPRE